MQTSNYLKKDQLKAQFKLVDDFSRNKSCRFCGKKVLEIQPQNCPHCGKPFESRADYFFRHAAYLLVGLAAIYLWQKVMLGFF